MKHKFHLPFVLLRMPALLSVPTIFYALQVEWTYSGDRSQTTSEISEIPASSQIKKKGRIKHTEEKKESCTTNKIPSNTFLKKVKMKTRFRYEEDHQAILSEEDPHTKEQFVNDMLSESSDCERIKGEQIVDRSFAQPESSNDAALEVEEIINTSSVVNKFHTDLPMGKVILNESSTSIDDQQEVQLQVQVNDVKRDLPTSTSRKGKNVKMCCYCNIQVNNLGNHILENHATRSGQGFKCNICNRIIQKKLYNFNEHLKTHTDVNHFLCADCGIGFKRAAAHKIHMETVHANKVSTYPSVQKTKNFWAIVFITTAKTSEILFCETL